MLSAGRVVASAPPADKGYRTLSAHRELSGELSATRRKLTVARIGTDKSATRLRASSGRPQKVVATYFADTSLWIGLSTRRDQHQSRGYSLGAAASGCPLSGQRIVFSFTRPSQRVTDRENELL